MTGGFVFKKQEFRSCRSSGVAGVQEFRSSGVQEFRSSGVAQGGVTRNSDNPYLIQVAYRISAGCALFLLNGRYCKRESISAPPGAFCNFCNS
jgi:hypothetical protein